MNFSIELNHHTSLIFYFTSHSTKKKIMTKNSVIMKRRGKILCGFLKSCACVSSLFGLASTFFEVRNLLFNGHFIPVNRKVHAKNNSGKLPIFLFSIHKIWKFTCSHARAIEYFEFHTQVCFFVLVVIEFRFLSHLLAFTICIVIHSMPFHFNGVLPFIISIYLASMLFTYRYRYIFFSAPKC